MALLILAFPFGLRAAVEYSVTIDTVGDPLSPHRELRVVVDGPRRRVEVRKPEINPIPFDVFVADLRQREGFTGLNTDLKTWWYPASPISVALGRPRTFTMTNAAIRDVTVTAVEESGAEEIAGFPTRKFVVQASFRRTGSISDTKVSVLEHTTLMVWTTDKIDPAVSVLPLPYRTGEREVDDLVMSRLAIVSGSPLRIVTSATSTWEGGPPRTEISTKTVSGYREVEAGPHLFEVPEGYVRRETAIGVPGAAR